MTVSTEARTTQGNTRPRIPAERAAPVADAYAYGDGSIHDALAWIRHNEPLGIAEVEGFDPFWVVTKHADLRAIGNRNELFLSGEHPITLRTQDEIATLREAQKGRPHPLRGLVMMDQPDHGVYRSILSKQFLRPNVAKMEDQLRPIAKEFAQRFLDTGGECDFASAIAFKYPLRVVMSLLGVPESDEEHLLRLTLEMFGGRDPEFARAPKDGEIRNNPAESYVAAIRDIFAYFKGLNAERRANPRDDISSILATAQIDGEHLPEVELLSYYLLLATAGHDTTAASTGGAMVELANNPAELRKVQNDPQLYGPLADEAIRFVAPAKMTMRKAAGDFELRGREIRKGDVVGLAWASGNRDEEVFTDPDRFIADRSPNPHLGLGQGPHACLGQHLARLEMRLLFEEILPMIDTLEMTGPIRNMCSFQTSGPKVVPIRFTTR